MLIEAKPLQPYLNQKEKMLIRCTANQTLDKLASDEKLHKAVEKSFLTALNDYIIVYGKHIFKYCGEFDDIFTDNDILMV